MNVTPHGTVPSFADMSAQQRSASMDNIVRQVATLTASNNALVTVIQECSTRLNEIERRVDALSESAQVNALFRGRRFLLRLRWMVTGR